MIVIEFILGIKTETQTEIDIAIGGMKGEVGIHLTGIMDTDPDQERGQDQERGDQDRENEDHENGDQDQGRGTTDVDTIDHDQETETGGGLDLVTGIGIVMKCRNGGIMTGGITGLLENEGGREVVHQKMTDLDPDHKTRRCRKENLQGKRIMI